MSEKNITVKISNQVENSEIKVPAIFKDNYVEYKEQEDTTVIYNYQSNTLRRENKDLIIEAKFVENEEAEWLITAKEIKRTLPIYVKTNKLEIKDKNIKIEYILEGILYTYTLEVKE